jgi:tetrapyrrole methylase family protein/MazG family protein
VQQLLDELKERFGFSVGEGLQVLTPAAIMSRPFDPGLAVLMLPGDLEDETVLPGRQAHGAGTVAMLRGLYPAEHPVRGLEGSSDTTIGELTDAHLHTATYFLPAVESLANAASPHGLPWLVARLRAPDGCPWDREQDHRSLRKFLLEETYEVYDALDRGSTPELAEELGDLLLQIVLHAHYAAEDGVFDMSDVYREVMAKIVRRHPHVFGDAVANSAADVIRSWEQIKAQERVRAGGNGKRGGTDKGMPAAFAGLSRSLPALAYAQEMQERAASLGYDWPSVDGVLEKVAEEAAELVSAPDDRAQREELGDLLMVLVNLARKLGIDAEATLRAASAKFAARFAHVERLAAERQVELRSLTFEELDELWDEAKVVTNESRR